jgi:ferredoxin
MTEVGLALHYVCTPAESRNLVEGRSRFWVSNCGCREQKGGCKRSRMDVCLMFQGSDSGSGSGIHEISRDQVEEILQEAQLKRLVSRPFRDTSDMRKTDGICFCCDDCCGYFLNPEERCDKGVLEALTDLNQCNDCLACVAVCHFGARSAVGSALHFDPETCYGCGLCAEVCPSKGIRMVARA